MSFRKRLHPSEIHRGTFEKRGNPFIRVNLASPVYIFSSRFDSCRTVFFAATNFRVTALKSRHDHDEARESIGIVRAVSLLIRSDRVLPRRLRIRKGGKLGCVCESWRAYYAIVLSRITPTDVSSIILLHRGTHAHRSIQLSRMGTERRPRGPSGNSESRDLTSFRG